MPDAPSQPAAGTLLDCCPQARSAARRYGSLLAKGYAPGDALADMVAYLVVLRPGLPRVLAHEQAEAIVAALRALPCATPHPPQALLIELATPALPHDG
jgi:hypothetical protein